MPGTVTEEIEIMDAGHGETPSPPAGGDDDGGSGGGGAAAVPRRAYFTARSRVASTVRERRRPFAIGGL